MRPPRLQFVILDGARARWVSRTHDTLAFHTERIEERPHASHGGPEGVAFESASGRRATIQPHVPAAVKERDHFAEKVAHEVEEAVKADPSIALALVAPARVLKSVEERLSARARGRVLHRLAKDLTKVPDGELGAWLARLERELNPAHSAKG